MADSKRKQILDAIVTACGNIAGVKSAQTEYHAYWEMPPHQFPRITVRDMKTDLSELSFASTSETDKEATMRVECILYVHDMHNALAKKRTDLLYDVERSVLASTAIGALVHRIDSREIDTDNEVIDNFSIASVAFDAVYHYNHLSP